MNRDDLVLSNLGLPKRIAREYRCGSLSYGDRIGIANLALAQAAKEFDPRFGTPFANFAGVKIRIALRRARAAEGAEKARAIGGCEELEAAAAAEYSPEFEAVWDAIEQLPADDQAVAIKAFDLDGTGEMSRRAISEATGLSLKQVRAAKARSIERLRELLRA